MDTKIKLGQLKPIPDLRGVWDSEPRNFTKWLSKEENLNLLSAQLGINISLIKTEARKGDFHVDILAEETETGRKIIIENQLERTDHDHLGKIITYASGYEAEIIIWIVKEFRSEHKAAVDWLNEHTDEKTNFFGICIELWQIDSSAIAPRFNIISQPNTWAKTIKSISKKGDLSEIALKELEFFEEFISFAKKKETELNLGRPQPSAPAYYSVGIGNSLAWLAFKINTSRKVIKVDLYFKQKDPFLTIKDELETEANEKFPQLIWDEMPNYKGATIGLEIKNFTLNNSNKWSDNFELMLKYAEGLVRFFSPILFKLRDQ